MAFCQEFSRPYLAVSLGNPDALRKVHDWLEQFFLSGAHSPLVLNVAGPRESKVSGIQKRTRNFLIDVLKTAQ